MLATMVYDDNPVYVFVSASCVVRFRDSLCLSVALLGCC